MAKEQLMNEIDVKDKTIESKNHEMECLQENLTVAESKETSFRETLSSK